MVDCANDSLEAEFESGHLDLIEGEARLDERERILDERERVLEEREARLEEREWDMNERLAASEASLEERQKRLDELESRLEMRATRLDELDLELTKRAVNLDEQEAAYKLKLTNLIDLDVSQARDRSDTFSRAVEQSSEQQPKSPNGAPGQLDDSLVSQNTDQELLIKPDSDDDSPSPKVEHQKTSVSIIVEENELDEQLVPRTPPKRAHVRESIDQWSVNRLKNNMSVKSLVKSLEKQRRP